MDLDLYGRVLWRHRFLVLGGVALACALAVFSIARVTWEDGRPRLQYRSDEVWESSSTLQLTQPGFPEGSVLLDVGRLSSLAEVYAVLVTSDEVMQIVRKTGPLGSARGIALQTADKEPSPFIAISSAAATPDQAVSVTRRATDAFLTYVRQRQSAAGIPGGLRVSLRVVDSPKGAFLVAPRKKTVPVVVFLAVLSATVGLAFLLENTRRRRGTLRAVEQPGSGESVEAGEVLVYKLERGDEDISELGEPGPSPDPPKWA